MRALQSDYDRFYERILYAIDNIDSGLRIKEGACAACPRRLSLQDKIKAEVERRCQPYDEAISLSDMKYGKYIDKQYKDLFIKLQKNGDLKAINDLEYKIAKDINEKNKNKTNLYWDLFKMPDKKRTYSLFDKFLYFIGL